MCGILGIYSPNHNLPFKEALNQLIHRGPDQKGIFQEFYRENILSLGFRRLAIQDLSIMVTNL